MATSGNGLQHLQETVTISVATKAAYTGGAISVLGGLTTSEVASLIGCALAALGALVNWYYHHKRDAREERESAARMKRAILESRARIAIVTGVPRKEEDEE